MVDDKPFLIYKPKIWYESEKAKARWPKLWVNKMEFMEYPKIDSLCFRDIGKPRKLILGEYSCREFQSIDTWTVTEKIDGMNIRIMYEQEEGQVKIGGRTENAMIPSILLGYLLRTFTNEVMRAKFQSAKKVIFFGEGYGPKIQSGGYYAEEPGFVLFDVWFDGMWLGRDSVWAIARDLGIENVPLLIRENIVCPKANEEWIWTKQEILDYVRSKPLSKFAKVSQRVMEGIVARSEPLMMFRKSGPIMFKLKCKDFE